MTDRAPAAALLQPGLMDRLAHDGYALAAEAGALETDAAAIDAGVGRNTAETAGRASAHAHDGTVRRARIRWLDDTTDAQHTFLVQTERLRLELNRTLYLGLGSFEAQLALTPVDGFYARHVDSFHGTQNRIVSLVAYLSANWDVADGGCLRIWPENETHGDEPARCDVVPHCATLVLMLSETIPHAVLPTRRARASIAGWFRLQGSGAG
jgi:SM-20-related protein